MAKKTHGIELLIVDALKAVPTPYGEDIILDVALTIEADPALLSRYQAEVERLSASVANQWIGQYVRLHTQKKTGAQVTAGKKTIIGSYTKLLS